MAIDARIAENGDADDAEEHDVVQRSFTILYGTQTGNAQDVAERISRQAQRQHITAHVYAMDEYDITDLISESLVVMILGTTGNGDFPTAALPFWRFLLRSDLPDDILSDVTFASFGLGDSSYKRFCWPVRKMNKRLRGLGAVELVPSGEADDQHYLGIEGALRPWLDTFWSTLNDILPEAKLEAIPDDVLLRPPIEVILSSNEPNSSSLKVPTAQSNLHTGWHWARLTRNDRLTSVDHWQDVRLFEIETDEERIEYRPTDVLSVVPENSAEDVQRLLDRLGWSECADENITLTSTTDDARIPQRLALEKQLTMRRLLTAYLDFKAVPRPSFFERMLPFTPSDHMQHEKLQEYCTPGEGADEMYEYAIRVRRTILEVLEEFDAVDIPFSHALDVFPLIRKREFSIASAAPCIEGGGGTSVQLAVAIVDYKTRLKERRKGLCTSWLAQLQVGDRIPIHVAPSAMATQALRNHTIPAMFVGPGTGVAPVRSAIWTRYNALQRQGKSQGGGMQARDNLCFFGCRNRTKDYLFGDEWQLLQEQGSIEAHLAASRDQEEKVYVQNLVAQQAERVWDIVGPKKGLVYVCGSAGKMPQAVRASVVEACAKHGGMTDEKAEQYVDRMESQGRWIEECWE